MRSFSHISLCEQEQQLQAMVEAAQTCPCRYVWTGPGWYTLAEARDCWEPVASVLVSLRSALGEADPAYRNLLLQLVDAEKDRRGLTVPKAPVWEADAGDEQIYRSSHGMVVRKADAGLWTWELLTYSSAGPPTTYTVRAAGVLRKGYAGTLVGAMSAALVAASVMRAAWAASLYTASDWKYEGREARAAFGLTSITIRYVVWDVWYCEQLPEYGVAFGLPDLRSQLASLELWQHAQLEPSYAVDSPLLVFGRAAD